MHGHRANRQQSPETSLAMTWSVSDAPSALLSDWGQRAVRSALISLLERLNDEMDEARRRGIPTNEAKKVEWLLSVARVVASLEDPRAISTLARVANHG